MHGGVIYVRGDIDDRYLAREVKKMELDADDIDRLSGLVKEYCQHFGCDYDRGHGKEVHQAGSEVAPAVRQPVRPLIIFSHLRQMTDMRCRADEMKISTSRRHVF